MGLAAALRKIYVKTDKQFIFLIDEWDCIMRERQESEGLQRQYLDFLRNLLKDGFTTSPGEAERTAGEIESSGME